MDKFLIYDDETGWLINERATELYEKLSGLDVSALGMPDYCVYYYNASHSKRLFFSIETSAHLLYKAITLSGKNIGDITIMDYGAGVGTLYLLAKHIGCRKVIYNDHLEDWRISAQLIAEAIGIDIDEYIVGEIDDCLNKLDELSIQCDIITSRNVVEHIYKLDVFYNAVRERQPNAIIYSSTTANKKNPASVIKHILWHRKWEKVFRGKRVVTIERQSPGLTHSKKTILAKATRGLAADDLRKAVDDFRKTGVLPNPRLNRTNTCDPSNGVWAEHLLSENEYSRLINEKNYQVNFESGFWDTHYQMPLMNVIGRSLNRMIARKGKMAMRMAPFIYVIAIPR